MLVCLPGTGNTATSTPSYFSMTRLEREIVRNCRENVTEPSHISPHNEAEQVTKVVIGLHIFDLGENVDSEAISLTSLPVATVQIISTG